MGLQREALDQHWTTLVAELRAHPDVTVDVATRNPPISSAAAAAAFAAIGIDPTPDLLAYITWSNGLKLQWRVSEADGFAGSIEIPAVAVWGNPDAWPGPSDALDDPVDSYNVDDAAILFDFFQRHEDNIEVAGLLPSTKDLAVFVSEDDIACVTDTALVSFGEYISLLLRSFRSPLARAALQMGFANREGKFARDLFPAMLAKSPGLESIISLARSHPNVGETRDFFRS